MNNRISVDLATLVRELNLEVYHQATTFDSVRISTWEVTRPGLPFAGFYDYFDPTRSQVIGKLELTYLADMDADEARASMDRYMASGITFCIVAHDMPVPDYMLNAANRNNVSILRTPISTSNFEAKLILSLNTLLAPRTTVHGVLMEIFGEGVLITGESGVGKSENAMALLRRGHRLVADDAIEIKKTADDTLIGTAPELIRNFLEVRGIGLVDAGHMFGIGAVKPEQVIDLVVRFELWDENTTYDRLGIETQYTEILGVKLPYNVIPVRPGRNLDAILELAAMNNRERKMGYNAAQILVERHDRLVDGGI